MLHDNFSISSKRLSKGAAAMWSGQDGINSVYWGRAANLCVIFFVSVYNLMLH